MSDAKSWAEIEKRMFGEKKVEWENEYYQFVSDHWTRDATKKMREMDIRGIELRGWTAYKLIPKTEDGEGGYIIFDGKGEPYRDFDTPGDMLFWIDAKKINDSYDNDIVTMVEKRMEKEESE